MGALQISLLGGFELRRDDVTVAAPPLRAARSLLAFLVLHRDRAHTRDLLAGKFWPDLPESRARRRLSHALWQIQSAVGDADERFLLTDTDTVRVDPEAEFWLDVDELEWTLEQADADAPLDRGKEAELLTGAIALYRGDLLTGFYDDWLIPDHDRLRERFLTAIDRLTDLAMARSDYETALRHARRLVQEDPFREEAHRRVMRIAALLGRHNDAIRQFEHCRAVLAEELGSEPSSETEVLYEKIIADRSAGHRAMVVSPESPLFEGDERTPFVGRERERVTVLEHLDGVLDNNGFVTGGDRHRPGDGGIPRSPKLSVPG
jgi:DNA-binding SARP family transcriptional activator